MHALGGLPAPVLITVVYSNKTIATRYSTQTNNGAVRSVLSQRVVQCGIRYNGYVRILVSEYYHTGDLHVYALLNMCS